MLPGFSRGFTTCSVPPRLQFVFLYFSQFFLYIRWLFFTTCVWVWISSWFFCVLLCSAFIFIWSEWEHTQLLRGTECRKPICNKDWEWRRWTWDMVAESWERCWHITRERERESRGQLLSINFMQINSKTSNCSDEKNHHSIYSTYISEGALRRCKNETLHNSKLRERAQRGNCIINVKGRHPALAPSLLANSATALPCSALALPARPAQWQRDKNKNELW